MSDQSESIKARFIRLQNLLTTETKNELTHYYINEQIKCLKQADLSNQAVVKNQIYEELRDTVKTIFAYLDKVTPSHHDITLKIETAIKELLITISHFCSAFYCMYHPVGCGEMIRQFLSSQCRLFIYQVQAGAVSLEEKIKKDTIQIEEIQRKWTKESCFKTVFYCQCVEVIMNNLSKFQTKFGQMKLVVIGQYLRLLYYIDDYLLQEKVLELGISHTDILTLNFQNPTKENMLNANKQSLDQIIEYLTKLLRYCKNQQIKKRIQLLGAQLSISMLKLPSIQKKMVGCKILSKYSYDVYYRSTSYLTESFYGEWVVKQGFFELIFEDHCQSTLIKASQDTFKFLVKKGMIDKGKFIKFFEILQKADNDLRRAMFKLIEPFRVDYDQIQSMLQIFKNLKGLQLYDDQFFYFVEGLSRYSTQAQLKVMLGIIQFIVNEYYSKFQTYLTKKRSVQCYAYIFQRLLTFKDPEDRLKAYTNITQEFLSHPTENKLIMLKTLYESMTQSKFDLYYQQRLALTVIDQLNFIQRSFTLFKTMHRNKDDLIYFIRGILKKYKSLSQKKGFSSHILREAVDFPEVFEEMLELTKDSQLQGLLNQLSDLAAIKQFSFSCIKSVFFKLNWQNLKAIKKQYTDFIATNVTIENPDNFIGISILKYLIFNSTQQSVRKGACELLVSVYTNFGDDFRQQGQIYLIQFMKKMIILMDHNFHQYFQVKASAITIAGTLQLMQELMLSTEYFGVGNLRAHNSQVPTSTTLLKIYNNATYGQDVLKIFQKKIPSNKTLFDVIVDVSKQFKIGPLDIALQYPSNYTIKHNGLTLEELKLNRQELNAIKLPQSRFKKQPLLVDGELSARSKAVFTDMFNRFAPTGKMGKKQSADYIEGATLGYCQIFDSRITTLFQDYDSDKDDILTLQDFLRFYKDCVVDPQKAEVVDKNLINLRYRRDLKSFDAQIDSLNIQALFRYHIWSDKNIYEYLFKISQGNDSSLALLAQKLLLRLPTYSKVTESLTDTIDLKNKNAFQISYMLTAIQSQLTNQPNASQHFIASQNHLSIFEYLLILNSKQIRLEDDQNCLIICLHILRSLLGIHNIINVHDLFQRQMPQPNFQLPKTDVFISIIRQSIERGDSTLLEPAFALQLTQSQLPLQWIEQSAFSKDKDTRILTCNFLYLWLLNNKSQDLNLFDIEISPFNNEQWFNLLTEITHLNNKHIDYHKLFTTKIKVLQKSQQSLQGNRFNPIVHGNLKIIKQIYSNLTSKDKEMLNQTLGHLIPKLLSNQNRQFAYELRYKDYPLQLLNDLKAVINVRIGKQTQTRFKYVGIRNLGCICYMNSILQQFFMIKHFYNLVLSLQSITEESQINGIRLVDDFLAQLQEMYIHLEWTQKQYYDPTKFCLAIKDHQGQPINTHIQEDAHQFLNAMFGKMEEYAKKQEKLKILENIFGGKSVTQIICQTCQNKIQVLQHFYHLSVEVKGMKTLKESFDKLIQPQQISDYFCINCNKRVDKITKQMLIKQSPQILIINLQRIIFDLQTFLKVKVHTKLQFQQTLDLHNYFSSSNKPAPYELKGVVIHSGTSEGGHYYSLIKRQDKWYKFNDQSVTLFNYSDMGRQAFGGQQVTDTWGEQSSSTNAYILFYQKIKNSQEDEQQSLLSTNNLLIQKVLAQNKNFALQLQYNQPSFFFALHQLYKKYIQQFSNQKELGTIASIYFQVLQHLSINSDIKSQILNQVKDNILDLLQKLPQKAEQFINQITINSYRQVICLNNDANVRDIYQRVITKIIKILLVQNKQRVKVLEIIQSLINLLSDDMLLKNIHKSYQYFEMWKSMIQNQQIIQILLKQNKTVLFLDILMGSDSVLAGKDKKRSDVHSSQVLPIIPIITALFAYKLNMVGETPQHKQGKQFYSLTQKQIQIVNDQNFYKKMMKNKLDMGLLKPIIQLMAFKDERYTKFMVQIMIKSMNSLDEMQDKNIIFLNIKALLLIQDELTHQRIKWILGIPQLDSIRYYQNQFGLVASSQSKVYTYVSSLLYIKEEKYMPFLSILFEKRKYFNPFSANGIIALLELMIESAHILNFVLSLPAPTYIHKTYVDWIQTYAMKVKLEQHYSLPFDKNILADKLKTLQNHYKQKAKATILYDHLPVNKYIIGKNASVILLGRIAASGYQIQMFGHQTYVLVNRPYGLGNFQLPDDEFSFSSILQSDRSKFFLKSYEKPLTQCNQLQKKFTVLTFNIKTETSLIIKFKVPGFQHNIHLKNGDHSINCPYTEGQISNLIEVEQGQKQIQKQLQVLRLNELPPIPPFQTFITNTSGTFTKPKQTSTFDYYMQVNCKACTYLNVGRQRCQICDADLFL